MIHTYIPYNLDGNLGKAYNDFMQLVNEEDWVCFLDHDAMFTNREWYNDLQLFTEKNYDLITGVTNRIANPEQKVNVDVNNHDINYHRKVSVDLRSIYGVDITDPKYLISGVVMLVSKKTWNKVKFREGFLGVDNAFHKDLIDNNLKVGIARGLYVYHYYGADGKGSHNQTEINSKYPKPRI